jgi:hypothetical protein
MKFIAIILVLLSTSLFAQSKKELAAEVDKLKAQVAEMNTL